MNRLFLSTIAIFSITIAYSQTQAPFQGPLTNMKGSDYKFTIIKSLDANAVQNQNQTSTCWSCLLYTSPSPRDRQKSRMPSSA
mgnify:CR=1 FL=1